MSNNTILSLDQVRAAAPAAFSHYPADGLSDSYSHVTTANVLDALLQDGWNVTSARQNNFRKEVNRLHVRHEIALTHPELPEHKEGRCQLLLGNSSNGSSAVRTIGGFLRAACLNQNYSGLKAVSGVFHHRGGSLEERVVAGARNARKNFDQVITAYDLWNQIELSPEQQIQFLRAATPLRWGAQEVFVDEKLALAPRRLQDAGNSLWLTYNRVQEALVRGGFSGSFVKRDEAGQILETRLSNVRRVTGIATNERINLGLWDLAQSFVPGAVEAAV